MTPAIKLRRGQTVRIRAAGTNNDWVLARVQLASGNGKSVGLLIEDDSALRTAHGGMYIGFVPLMVDYEEGIIEDLSGSAFEIDTPSLVFAVASPEPMPIGIVIGSSTPLRIVRELTKWEFDALREYIGGDPQLGAYYPADGQRGPAGAPDAARMKYFYQAEPSEEIRNAEQK